MFLNLLNLISLILFFVFVTISRIFLGNAYFYWDYGRSVFEEKDSQVYDFIVVGSGSAGSVIANRLSKNNKVLLLDAGGDPIYPTSIPALALDLLHRPNFDWMYETTPQKHSSQSLVGKKSLWPRGKVLGGSSILNFMLYVRGHPLDYDNWANITGDVTWSYKNVQPFFKKSLDYHGQYINDEKNYGQTPYGNLHVEKREWAPANEYFFDAGREMGLEKIDLNGYQRTGMDTLEVTQKHGSRFGTYSAFIKPVLHRKNLHVSRYSQVTKIHFDKNLRAVGVYYTRHGKKRYASASKEIIISCGAVDSPKLLMLSGIGPKDALTSIGIKPKVDLPVGKNLKDHFAALLLPFLIDKPVSFIAERDMGIASLIDYYLRGYGPLTCPIAGHSQAFISTSRVKNDGIDWPDIQLYYGSYGISQSIDSDFAKGFGVEKEVLREFFEPVKGEDAVMLTPVLVRPKSIGEITLKDKDPFSKPLIDPRYLEHPDDVKALIEGINFAINLIEGTNSFKRLGAKLSDIRFPGCEDIVFRSDEYWECYIRQWGFSLYHGVGTCSMGKDKNDPKAVVDSKLRVLETVGLRVADASIMPEIVNGNTNAPTIMVGEKASDFIREYWSEQYLVCNIIELLLKESKCFYTRLV